MSPFPIPSERKPAAISSAASRYSRQLYVRYLRRPPSWTGWCSAIALHQPVQEGGRRKYRTYSWREYRDAALEIAAGLRSLGIGKGDIVALDSETRAEFYLSDLGIMANGSIAAALYNSYPAA